ncbi:MAG: tetratricopeptide repeat protein [Oscillatoria princeps RMCB-10]|nr:tetratricopeptide repeat protein [Oscillatoria princeps RMCB-10]
MNNKLLFLIAGTGTLLMLPAPAFSAPAPGTPAPAFQLASQLSEAQLKQIAQSVTVRVLSGDSSGSGILIKKDGEVYTVLTNQHVLEPGKPARIQAPDGQIYAADFVRNVNFQSKDLTLLQFRAKANYAVAALGNLGTVAINEPVFAAGFPYESGFAFTAGQVLYVPVRAFKEGYQIGYSNDIEKGMSGGPILNGQGLVIGINGIYAYPLWGDPYIYEDGSRPTAAERDLMSRYSWGIPIQTFAQLAPAYAGQAALASTNSPPKASLPPIANDVNNTAEKITVLIEWETGNGSGVIVAKQGSTYYVLTAEHVVRNRTNFEVVAPDGKRYAVTVTESNVKTLPGVDLAVVQFASSEDYAVATLANYDLKTERGFIFTSGWPKVEAGSQASWLLTPGIIFSKEEGAVLGKDSYSLQYGYELVYTNITAGGMSGGPVLDSRGRVIGIHGRAEGETPVDQAGKPARSIQLGYSLGVPVRTFVNLALQVGVDPGWLRVQKEAPPVLTGFERSSIQESLLKVDAPGSSADAAAWLNYGNQLWRLGKNEEALAAFDRAIQIQPAFYQAWYAKGLTLSFQSRYEKAIAAFDRAIRESQEKFAPAWRWRGGALQSLKRYEEALASYDKAIALDPNNFIVYVWRGVALNELKRNQEAIAAYSKAIELNPNHPYAYNNRGNARSDLGDKQGAIADYNESLRLNNPEPHYVYNNRGNARSYLGDKQGAIADYNKAIELQPDFVYAYNGRGNARSDLGDKQGAIADYSKAIELQPDFAYAYNGRGNARSDLGDKSGAIADYSKAIELKRDYAEAYNGRGNARSDLGDKQGAIADYNESLRLNNPEPHIVYNNRGNARSALGDKQGAIADYTKAIELQPDFVYAYNGRGNAHYALGDKQGAIADYNKAIELKPDYADSYIIRGLARYDLGDFQGALADYNQALTIDKKLLPPIVKIGLIKYEMGEVEEAIRQWRSAVEIDGKQAEPQLAIAVALYAKGDTQQGLAMAEAALKLDSRFGKLEFLKENLWGDKLRADANKLLKTPQIQALLSQAKSTAPARD